MSTRTARSAVLVFVAVLMSSTSVMPQSSSPFKIIVNPVNPTTSLSKAQVSGLFLRRTTTWETGEPVLPVDQVETSPLRETFSREVLGMSPSAAHDAAAAARGELPAVATDREVLAYVRLKPGAIGYVSASAPVDGVKVLAFGRSAGGGGGQEPLRVGGAIAPPEKRVNVAPVYPMSARTARVEGSVDLEITIGPDGSVDDVTVIKPVHQLTDAAIAAVRRWKYAPTIVNGAPVPVKMMVRVAFTLDK